MESEWCSKGVDINFYVHDWYSYAEKVYNSDLNTGKPGLPDVDIIFVGHLYLIRTIYE